MQGEKLSFIMGEQDAGRRKQSVTSAPGEKSDFKIPQPREKRPSMKKPRINTLQDIAEEPYTTPVPDTPEVVENSEENNDNELEGLENGLGNELGGLENELGNDLNDFENQNDFSVPDGNDIIQQQNTSVEEVG